MKVLFSKDLQREGLPDRSRLVRAPGCECPYFDGMLRRDLGSNCDVSLDHVDHAVSSHTSTSRGHSMPSHESLRCLLARRQRQEVGGGPAIGLGLPAEADRRLWLLLFHIEVAQRRLYLGQEEGPIHVKLAGVRRAIDLIIGNLELSNVISQIL